MRRGWSWALACALLSCAPWQAQTAGASLLGIVRDPSGARVPRAQVKVRKVSTGAEIARAHFGSTGVAIAAAPLMAQAPAPNQGGAARPGGAGAQPAPRFSPREAYPQRPPADPAAVNRGKALYGVNCGFCHGSDARGGEGGPNLLRSQLVLNDQNGELITPVVQNGRPEQGMPKLELTAEQVSDIAAFLHSFRVGGYDISRQKPPSIVVGDAQAGEAYFNARCASCHSVTGDLKGLAAKFNDPRILQQMWLMPSARFGFGGRGPGAPPTTNAPPTTVTVTLASGEKVEGRLGRMDDFIVGLTQSDGTTRTFRRNGDTPKVEIHDPLRPHRDLLRTYTDKDIHNVTAYLVTLK